MQSTPFHRKLPPQQTPLTQAQFSLAATTSTPDATKPPSSLDGRPSTPLKMFTQTPPSAQGSGVSDPGPLDQGSAASAVSISSSAHSRKPSFRSSPVAIRLPALSAKGSYSYGSVGTVAIPRMSIHETGRRSSDLIQQMDRETPFYGQETGRPGADLLLKSHDHVKRWAASRSQNAQAGIEEEDDMPYAFDIDYYNTRRTRSGRKYQDATNHRSTQPTLSEPPSQPTPPPSQPPLQSSSQPQRGRRKRWHPKYMSEACSAFFGRTVGGFKENVGSWFASRPSTKRPNTRRSANKPLLGNYSNIARSFISHYLLSPTLLAAILISLVVFFMGPSIISASHRPLRALSDWYHEVYKSYPDIDYTAPTSLPRDEKEFLQRLGALELKMEQFVKDRRVHYDGSDFAHRAFGRDIESVNARYQKLSEFVNSEKKKTDTHDTLLDKLRMEIDQEIKPSISRFYGMNRELGDILKKIEENLPEMLPVRRDGNGKLIISPDFYQHMRDLFAAEFPRATIDGDVAVVGGSYNWDNFLTQNEQQLKLYIDHTQQELWQTAMREQTIISRAQFMDLLKEEIAALDRKLHENYDDLHYKYKSTSAGLTYLRAILDKSRTSAMDLADGYYSPKLTDYAGHAGGAYIDVSRTSPTFDYLRQNIVIRWVYRAVSRNIIPQPLTVISSVAREPGNCWPFPGKQGHVAIVLRQRIYPTALTLEHIEWPLALSKDAAPKTVSLWAKVEPSDMYDDVVAAAQAAQQVSAEFIRPPKSAPYMRGYARLGRFHYEFGEGSPPVQTWNIPIDMKALNASSERVLVLVHDNYGNDIYTCLYRVRVHGEPVGG